MAVDGKSMLKARLILVSNSAARTESMPRSKKPVRRFIVLRLGRSSSFPTSSLRYCSISAGAMVPAGWIRGAGGFH